MQRFVGVNKEVLKCDLERAKISLQATEFGILPTNLKIIRDKYIHILSKTKYLEGKSVIDDNALEIIHRYSISLKDNIKPIR